MNHLATTTQILDLLVPLTDADRTRVIRSVQAVVDMTVDAGGLANDGPVPFHGIEVPVRDIVVGHTSYGSGSVIVGIGEKEKPPTAAPKARKPNEKGALRLALAEQIPALIRQQGRPLRPAEMHRLLSVPSKSVSTLSTALKDLLDAGKLSASGTTASRYYDVVSP